MRNKCTSIGFFELQCEKKSPPPPPPEMFQYFFTPIFFLHAQYLKNSYTIQTTFHQYQKLYSTPPWHGARTCNVPAKFRENTSMHFRVTVRKLNVTDRRTDRQTDGRGALQYLPSRAFGAAGDNYVARLYVHLIQHGYYYVHLIIIRLLI